MDTEVLNFLPTVGSESPESTISAIKAVASLFPSGEYPTWPICESYLRQCISVLGHDFPDDDAAVELLSKVVRFLTLKCRYVEAEEYGARLSEMSVRIFRSSDPRRIDAQLQSATLKFLMGTFVEAEAEIIPALEEAEGSLGLDLITLRCRECLAATWRRLDKRAESEGLLRRTLADARKSLPPNHPFLFRVMAALCKVVGEPPIGQEKRSLIQEAIRGQEQVLQPGDPDLLASKRELMCLLQLSSQVEEGSRLAKEAVDESRRYLGYEHTETCFITYVWMDYLRRQGNVGGILELARRNDEQLRKLLGPQHPDTLIAMSHTARLLFLAGKDEDAARLQEEVALQQARSSEDTVKVLDRYSRTGAVSDLKETIRVGQETVMASRRKRLTHDAYTVALICPLEVEMSAARYMLDEEHERLPRVSGDTNQYILGELCGHKVAIASLPAGYQGTLSAATLSRDMARTYPSITLRLLVGIGGGVPRDGVDIRLGDVVVSTPSGTHGGVVQYDLGKQTLTGFLRKGFLCPPPSEWLSVLTIMQSNRRTRPNMVSKFITEMLEKFPGLVEYRRPSQTSDILFQSDYGHGPGKGTCEDCDKARLVVRHKREAPDDPVVHYGTIASGDRVMKDGKERDKISKDSDGAICFEMEAAGLMNDFRCIVIRGIADYADSHKNDIWHPYAAAAAAGFAKEMLSYVDSFPGMSNPRGFTEEMQMEILILAGELLISSEIVAELFPAIFTDNAHCF